MSDAMLASTFSLILAVGEMFHAVPPRALLASGCAGLARLLLSLELLTHIVRIGTFDAFRQHPRHLRSIAPRLVPCRGASGATHRPASRVRRSISGAGRGGRAPTDWSRQTSR